LEALWFVVIDAELRVASRADEVSFGAGDFYNPRFPRLGFCGNSLSVIILSESVKFVSLNDHCILLNPPDGIL
jgi:hypothetical protein